MQRMMQGSDAHIRPPPRLSKMQATASSISRPTMRAMLRTCMEAWRMSAWRHGGSKCSRLAEFKYAEVGQLTSGLGGSVMCQKAVLNARLRSPIADVLPFMPHTMTPALNKSACMASSCDASPNHLSSVKPGLEHTYPMG